MLAANVTGHVAVAANSYDEVLDALVTKGPLTVTVDAGGWHDYETGIYSGTRSDCSRLASTPPVSVSRQSAVSMSPCTAMKST